MSQRWSVALFCGGVLYLTLYYQLGNLAFIGADEPRYARIAQEMNLRGSYVTPTLSFRPWLEKPPLLFWLEAVSFKIFAANEWSARFPVATLALLMALLVGAFVWSLQGARPAILTLLVLSTSCMFFAYGRAASTDMPLATMLTAALVSGFKASRDGSRGWAAICGLGLGLAVLAKGPVALLLFAGIFIVYSLLTQEWVWDLGQTIVVLTVFLGTSVPWFWKVWEENGYHFIATFWINHHLARFVTDIHHHSQPVWYYMVILTGGFFPWVVFLGSALLRFWRRRFRLVGQG